MTNIAARLEPKAENDSVDSAFAPFEAKIDTLTAKLNAANDNVKAVTARADALELRLNRPGIAANDNVAPSLDTKAFELFVRKGKEALNVDEVKSLRVSDDSTGGYINSPDDFVETLDRNVKLFSPIRQVASVRPTGSGAVVWPKRTGGMTASWVGEGPSARPETTVTFGSSRYPVCELAAWVDVSNAMLDDSALPILDLLAYEFGEEFGYQEGKAFVSGASVLSPSGFMQDANVFYTPGTDANLIKGDGLIDLYHAVKTPYRQNAVWLMNSTTLGAIRKLKDTNGNYMVAMAGLNNTPVSTLLGRPIIETPDMPDVTANAYPVAFGDFSQGYRIFDRVSLSILRDPYSQATNGMTRFHGRRRVAGGVGKAEAIRKLKIATS
ncbi:phage major capsid protein [Bradyrhizobium sp. AZCC 1721]|uniref:phage major capsid protein n=1 Tax=Bradyrhizobium sp. AZCC 1721 TaxID=3117016 RepID=UPI002FF044F5